MQIIHNDSIVSLGNNTDSKPDYDQENPLYMLNSIMQKMQLAAEREHYLSQSIQYLLPFDHLTLYPNKISGDLDPISFDNKEDFQHQNLKDILYTDTHLSRGWANLNGKTFPFLRISYRGGPDSLLSSKSNHALNDKIKLWIRIGENSVSKYLVVPYNPVSNRYDIELWGYPNDDAANHLDEKGLASLLSGELQINADLIQGDIQDFIRDNIDGQEIGELHTNNAMHPILPLKIALAWTDHNEQFWDSLNGKNYLYEFNMIYRGWDNFLKAGTSRNPHGGTGVLHFRNLLSNYWGYPDKPYSAQASISQVIEPWMKDAYGNKPHSPKTENFFKVEYMDMHILKPDCAIGLHRHRDNQEVFFMIEGEGYMIIGDWAKDDNRERCLEIRTLKSGHFVMLKGGNLHALVNTLPDPAMLFIFGGYD